MQIAIMSEEVDSRGLNSHSKLNFHPLVKLIGRVWECFHESVACPLADAGVIQTISIGNSLLGKHLQKYSLLEWSKKSL